MEVEVAVLVSPSLIVRTVFVDVKQTFKRGTGPSKLTSCVKVEVAVLGSVNSPSGLCGRKATLNFKNVQTAYPYCHNG